MILLPSPSLRSAADHRPTVCPPSLPPAFFCPLSVLSTRRPSHSDEVPSFALLAAAADVACGGDDDITHTAPSSALVATAGGDPYLGTAHFDAWHVCVALMTMMVMVMAENTTTVKKRAAGGEEEKEEANVVLAPSSSFSSSASLPSASCSHFQVSAATAASLLPTMISSVHAIVFDPLSLLLPLIPCMLESLSHTAAAAIC